MARGNIFATFEFWNFNLKSLMDYLTNQGMNLGHFVQEATKWQWHCRRHFLLLYQVLIHFRLITVSLAVK